MAAAKSDNAKGWALFGAVETGDLHAVAIQVLNGARVNWRNEYAVSSTVRFAAAPARAARRRDPAPACHVRAATCAKRRARCHAGLQSGQTALMTAAARGHDDVVRFLIDRGADLDVQDTVSALVGAWRPYLQRRGTKPSNIVSRWHCEVFCRDASVEPWYQATCGISDCPSCCPCTLRSRSTGRQH